MKYKIKNKNSKKEIRKQGLKPLPLMESNPFDKYADPATWTAIWTDNKICQDLKITNLQNKKFPS